MMEFLYIFLFVLGCVIAVLVLGVGGAALGIFLVSFFDKAEIRNPAESVYKFLDRVDVLGAKLGERVKNRRKK